MKEKKWERRTFLKTLGMGSLSLQIPALIEMPSRNNAKKERPNILFLFSDDQRYNTIHALNCPEIHTPHMDRLVRSGVAFTRAHIMGGTSGAVCMPSRAMLLTGRTLFHLKNRGATIPEKHIMMPELFKNAGYRTIGIGKWHNGKKAYERCFTHGGAIMFGGMSDHLKVPVYDFDKTGEYPKEKQYMGDKFSSVLFTDEAVRFLEEDDDGKPFLMYVSYTAPHDPRMAPSEFMQMYPPEKITLPENYMPEHPFDNGEMKIRDESLAPWPRTPEIVKEHLGAYYAMITHLDAQVGRLLDALEKSGKADNTIIVFSGDNGLAVGSHGLLGKQNLYEHSVRVPLIISGPGIPKGVKTDSPTYLLDIFPTLCELSDQPVPPTNEGKSLIPVLKNSGTKVRDSVFLAYTKIHRGVRTADNWKLIKYNVKGIQTTQLFDLDKDPHELNNLAKNKDYSARLEELTLLLKKHMRTLDDFCDLDKPNWGLPDETTEKRMVKHLAAGKKITLKNMYSDKYTGGGLNALVDGVRGTSDFRDGSWQGFEFHDLEAVIDLGKIMPVRKVAAGFLEDQGSWIFLPVLVEFSFSSDGKNFHSLQSITNETKSGRFKVIRDFSVEFNNARIRYVRVKAKNVGKCPSWHQGAGNDAWLFTDEIIVE